MVYMVIVMLSIVR